MIETGFLIFKVNRWLVKTIFQQSEKQENIAGEEEEKNPVL